MPVGPLSLVTVGLADQLDLACASWSAGTAATVFDYGEITIIQRFKSDLVKLEGIRSDDKPKV